MLMGAATVDIPAIVMNVGPMLNGKSGRDVLPEEALISRIQWIQARRLWWCHVGQPKDAVLRPHRSKAIYP